MSVVKQPYVVVNKLRASLPAGLDSQKLLVVGQKLSTGTAIEKTLISNVAKTDIADKFGAKSALGVTLSAIFEQFEQCQSPYIPRVDVIALEDGFASQKASATITLSASGGDDTVNKTGVLDFNVMGETIELSITEGDSITGDIAPALVASINDLVLPVTATNLGGLVTIQFNNGGTIGNGHTLKVEGVSKSGLDYFFSNMQVAITAFASGATNPTITDLFDIIEKVRYQTITYPAMLGTDLAVDFLDPRFNVANNVLDGVAILKKTDSKGNLETTLTALNSNCLVLLCNLAVAEDLFKGGEDLELDFVAAARLSAIRALRLTENANIINITPASASGANDAFGGMHIASLPYFNSPVSGSPLQSEGDGWTDAEIEELLGYGGSVMGNNKAGNVVILGEVVTTYKTDPAGNEDATWKFLETVDTMSVCAEYIFNNLKLDFAQTRLTQGDVVRGYSMTNKEAYISRLQTYYLALAAKALVPRSKAAMAFFTTNLSVTIDTVLGKITSTSELPIVVQLREILASLKTNFGSSLV